MMQQLGIDPKRLKLEWVSAGEGNKFCQVVNDFITEVIALGPLSTT